MNWTKDDLGIWTAGEYRIVRQHPAAGLWGSYDVFHKGTKIGEAETVPSAKQLAEKHANP